MTKTITAANTQAIIVFLPTLDREVDVPIQTKDSVQNVKIPTVGNIATVQVALQDDDIIATAATLCRNRISIKVTEWLMVTSFCLTTAMKMQKNTTVMTSRM